MKDLAEKVRFCVQSMCAVRWLTGLMPGDYTKRLVARATFLYLDAFLKLAPRLKNELKGIKADVSDVHERLRKLERDYEGNYSRIRDKLTAHRQELELADLIEAWHGVDLLSTTIFTEDAQQIYRLMADLHPDVPGYTDLEGVNDLAIATMVLAEFGDGPQGVQVGTDSLAITRPQTVTFIPTCDLQRQVMQVVSIIECFKFSNQLHGLLAAHTELQRIARALLTLDAVSMVDNLLARSGSPLSQSPCLLDLARKGNSAGLPVLEQAEATRDHMAEGRVREVRNKIAAHMDSQKALADLLRRLDTLAGADVSALVNHALSAFVNFCRQEGMSEFLMLHCRQLKGFDIATNRFSQPF